MLQSAETIWHRSGLMASKPGVAARSSVLRGVLSRSPHAHNLPQHDLTNESRATAASESSTSPVTISAILSWRGAEAQSVSLNHISRIAGEQFWSSPKEWRLTTYLRRYTSYTMSATIILGAQWGDEGKGKIVDVLCSGIQLCCRYVQTIDAVQALAHPVQFH